MKKAQAMSRVPTTDGARRTRDRVLSAALELFNERGSAAVTTNHVAEAAAVSPGNLYYWFSGKDEIVRVLYGQFVAAYEQLWGADQGDPLDLTPDEVLARLADAAALTSRYAFLARDLLGLVHGDPVLAAEYRAVGRRRVAEFTALAQSWRARGVMRRIDDGTIADLVQALWLVAETWLAFGELDGTRTQPEDGTRLLRVVLQPYLETDSRPSDGSGTGRTANTTG